MTFEALWFNSWLRRKNHSSFCLPFLGECFPHSQSLYISRHHLGDSAQWFHNHPEEMTWFCSRCAASAGRVSWCSCSFWNGSSRCPLFEMCPHWSLWSCRSDYSPFWSWSSTLSSRMWRYTKHNRHLPSSGLRRLILKEKRDSSAAVDCRTSSARRLSCFVSTDSRLLISPNSMTL